MKIYSGTISCWWALLPGLVSFLALLLFTLLRGRRIGFLGILSLIAAAFTCILWISSQYYYVDLTLLTYEDDPKYLDGTMTFLSARKGVLDYGHSIHREVNERGKRPGDKYLLFRPCLNWMINTDLQASGPTWAWLESRGWWTRFVAWTTHPEPATLKSANFGFWFGFRIWLLFIPFSIFPLWWTFRRILRSFQARDGYCATCGYDLRATPGKCPECGVVPKVKGSAGSQVLLGQHAVQDGVK